MSEINLERYEIINCDNLFATLKLEFRIHMTCGNRIIENDAFTAICNYNCNTGDIGDIPDFDMFLVINMKEDYFTNKLINVDKTIESDEKLIKLSSIIITHRDRFLFPDSKYVCYYTFGIINNFSKKFIKNVSKNEIEKYSDRLNDNKYKVYNIKSKNKDYFNPFLICLSDDEYNNKNDKIRYAYLTKNIFTNSNNVNLFSVNFIYKNYEGRYYDKCNKIDDYTYELSFIFDETNSSKFKYYCNTDTCNVSQFPFKRLNYRNDVSIQSTYYNDNNYLLGRLKFGKQYFNTISKNIKVPYQNLLKEELTSTVNIEFYKNKDTDDQFSNWIYIVEFESNNYITNGVLIISKEELDKIINGSSENDYKKDVLFVKKNNNSLLNDNNSDDKMNFGYTTIYNNVKIGFYSSKYSGLRTYKNIDKNYGLCKDNVENNSNFILKKLDSKNITKYVLKYKYDDNTIISLNNTFKYSPFELTMTFDSLCGKIYNKPIKKILDYNGTVGITIKKLNDIFSVAEIKFKLKYDRLHDKIYINSSSNLLDINTFIDEPYDKCYANKIGVIGIIPNMDNINNIDPNNKTKYIKFCDCIIGTPIFKLIDNTGREYNFGQYYLNNQDILIKHSNNCIKNEDKCCVKCDDLSGNTIDYIKLIKYMRNLIIANENYEYTIKLLLGNDPNIKYDFENCFEQKKDDRFLILTTSNDYYKIDGRFLEINDPDKFNDKIIYINYLSKPLDLINKDNNSPSKSSISDYYYNTDVGLFITDKSINNITIINNPSKKNTIILTSLILIFSFILIITFIIVVVSIRKRREKKLKDDILLDIEEIKERQRKQNTINN